MTSFKKNVLFIKSMGKSYKENPGKFKDRYQSKKKKGGHKKWQPEEKPSDDQYNGGYQNEKWES